MRFLKGLIVASQLICWVRPETRFKIPAGLISFHPGSNAEVATFQFAVHQLREAEVLPENVQIEMFDRKTCDTFDSPGYASELMQQHNLSVIFGPGCSKGMDPVAKLAVYWNIPVMGYVSTAEYLSNKNTYQTLIRLSATTTQDSRALIAFLEAMKWRKVAYVIRRADLGSETMATALKNCLDEASNIEVIAKYEIMEADPSQAEMESILLDLKNKARIIVLAVQELSVKGNITRNFMLAAHKLNMTGHDYVYVAPWALRRNNQMTLPWNYTDDSKNNAMARLAFRQVLVPMALGTDDWTMSQFIPNLVSWGINNGYPDLKTDKMVQELPIWLAFLFDAVYVYGYTVGRCINPGPGRKSCDWRNGTAIFKSFRNLELEVNSSSTCRSERHCMKTIRMDGRAERVFDFIVVGADPSDASSFNTTYYKLEADLPSLPSNAVDLYTFKFTTVKEFPWSDREKPKDVPECGIDGTQCSRFSTELVLVCSAAGLILSLCFLLAYKKRMHMIESDALAMHWCIDKEELTYFGGYRETGSTLSLLGSLKTDTIDSDSDTDSSDETPEIPLKASSLRGSYRERAVIIKTFIKRDDVNPWGSKEILLQVKALWELQHPNLNPILGLSKDQNKTQLLVLWGYEPKGSLQDVLSNEEIDLTLFKPSFAADIIQGVEYLHNSKLGIHGNLTGSNCLIDSRWMVKLTDFGVRSILSDYFERNLILWKTPIRMKLLHLAPEALQDFELNCPSGPRSSQTQKADIYALGIILYQIWFRTYWNSMTETTSTGKSSLKNLLNEFEESPFTRIPMIPKERPGVPDEIVGIIKQCWDDKPEARPKVSRIKKVLGRHIPWGTANVMDQMIKRVETYANNLERMVQARTAALKEERERADNLLGRMLPRSVCEKLKKGLSVSPEAFECATIYFSDIVGFTTICSQCTPLQVVKMLNSIYSSLDAVIGLFDAYKVETVGDSYLVVSGLPRRNGFKHCTEIADLAFSIREELSRVRFDFVSGWRLKARIGIHSGSVAAGVVGFSMPRYCLFGDSVNVASRLESMGEPMKIHTSRYTKELLETYGGGRYQFKARGLIELKGIGARETFWLSGRNAAQSLD